MTEKAAPTVYLHIGTPKSGTKYVQDRFAQNARLAKQQGLLWPGPGWRSHVEAARDLRRLEEGRSLDPSGPWSRVANQARKWRGDRVLVSMEWLASLTPHQIAAAVDSLRPCQVEVVCTARDLLRSFTAQWQEMTKNYRTWSWDQFVREVLAEDEHGPARQSFWRQQDVPAILARWLEVVPAERVHLVTLPPSGGDPELLWTRFCGVLGIDGAQFGPPRRDNASLGVVSTVLMHRLNLAARAQKLPHKQYKQVVQNAVGRRVLTPRRNREAAIAVSPEADMWLRGRAEQLTAQIRALGVHVVGDLDELLPGPPLQGREPSEVTDSELLDLCAEAMVSLGAEQQQEIARLRGRSAHAPAGARPDPSPLGIRGRVIRRVRHSSLGEAVAALRRAR